MCNKANISDADYYLKTWKLCAELIYGIYHINGYIMTTAL